MNNILNRFYLVSLLTMCLFLCLPYQAKAQREICWHGLEYQFSDKNTWGLDYPVITFIAANSPAEKAGLKLHDIIEKIDDYDCKTLGQEQFNRLLQSSKQPHILSVSNFAYKSKLRLLQLSCKYDNILDEAELAQIFASYSPQDVRQVKISYPFIFNTNKEFNYSNYKTFACLTAEGDTKELDQILNKEIREIMKEKGLIELTPKDAELIIAPYYELKYINNLKNGEGRFLWRYNSKDKGLIPQPIILNKELANMELLFGLTIQDQKTKQIIWSAEAKELLYNEMTIEQYALSNLELLLSSFPFVQKENDISYDISILRYNYTGLSFSAEDLSLITEVKLNSPAFNAGLKAGDRILAVNQRSFAGKTLNENFEDYLTKMNKLKKYQRSYKDQKALSLDFYKKDDYHKVNEHLKRTNWHTALSYLFAFRPQIKENPSQTIIFEVERRGEQYIVPIEAIIRDENNIRLCK